MNAIVYTKYGPPDVLQLIEVEKPSPNEDEVLVKVQASSVNPRDWHLMRADPFPIRLMVGLLKPKSTLIGSDMAGRVEAVGRNVKQFKPGDEVFGDIGGSVCVIAAGSFFLQLFLGPWMSMTGNNKIGTYQTVPNQKDLISIKELLEASKIVPVIDRRYPLSEVPEAIRYLEEGHARGKVIITVEHNGK